MPPKITNRSSYALAEIYSFSEECSILGVRQAMDTKRHNILRRLMWISMVCVGLGLALYQVVDRISSYAAFPTTTNVRVKQANVLPFPQVTICDENRMRLSVATSLGMVDALRIMFPFVTLSPPNYTSPSIDELLQRRYTQKQWDQIRYNLSQPIGDILQYPYGNTFGVTSFPTSVMKPIWTNMGLCYAFNAFGYNFSTTQPGATYGLSMILTANQAEYLVASSPCAGFRVLLHDPREIPMMLQLGFLVTVGSMTSVSFTLDNVTAMESPYSDCNASIEYRQINCQVQCLEDAVVQHCGCKENYMLGSARNCTIVEEFECVRPVLSFLASGNANQTECVCPQQCYVRRFDATITTSLMSEAFKAAYDDGDPRSLEKYFSQIQVYYSSLEFPDVTMEASYEFMSLLSDVGGALGLILGATLITVFEIAEFCYQLISDMVRVNTVAANQAAGDGGTKNEKDDRDTGGSEWMTDRGSTANVNKIFVSEVGVSQRTVTHSN